ncbi:hypothetical protein M9458_055720 [Cirrhinus mrigala]|uniref:Uncharacterized protein n=1 Tax=Cirrhinus mrigala TaxID=683832 RepID=A0ABD0MJA7_CIRMR
MAPSVLIQPQPQLADVTRMQQQATAYEISVWQQRGATRDANGLWRSHEGHMIAPTPLLTILISDAHGFDHCARGEVIVHLIYRQWWMSIYLNAKFAPKIMSEKEHLLQLAIYQSQKQTKEPKQFGIPSQISSDNGEEEETPCPVQPGDRVYLRVFRRTRIEPRREEGSTTWYHLNHCTRVPRLRPRRRKEQPKIDDEGDDAQTDPETRDSEEREDSNIDAPHFRGAEQAEAGELPEDEMLPAETEQEGQGETDPGPSADIPADAIAQDSGQPTGPIEPRPSTSAQSRYQPDEFLTLVPATIADLFL